MLFALSLTLRVDFMFQVSRLIKFMNYILILELKRLSCQLGKMLSELSHIALTLLEANSK
jgi:hypothetical protein